MQNNKFLKIITIFVTVVFVLEMVPLQALAFNPNYPVGMSSAWAERKNPPETWKYICSWGINPPGYEPDIQKGAEKEIFGNTYSHSGGYDSLSQGYYEDGVSSQPTAPITTTSFNARLNSRQYTEFNLKTDWRGRVSDKAYRELYSKRDSCCPDGRFYSDKCKTGTTKECLVNYCLSNLSDCNQVQKTATYYTYDKIDETSGGTFYSSKIIDVEATPLQAELTKREGGDTRTTTPNGKIVGCGFRIVNMYNYETKTCPVGINISLDTTVKLADGKTSNLCVMLYGKSFCSPGYSSVWTNHVFVSNQSPSIELLKQEVKITQIIDVANPQALVKSFTWASAGCDKDEGTWGSTYYCHKGLRASYLLADNSIWDGHYWWTQKKSVTNWGVLGFIVGWILNIILPGSGFLIFVGLGDFVFLGSLFIPGANISVTLSDLSEVSLCSATPAPVEVSQPTISAQKTSCDATSASVALSITPDSTKTGKVVGYELYRQKSGDTAQTLVKKQEGLSVEQSQSVIIVPDTVQNNQSYLYSVSLIVTSGLKTFAITTIATGPCTLPPTCTFSAKPSTIIKPGKSTLEWNCTNANNCKIDSESVNSTAGTKIVQPDKTTTYTLTCDGGISMPAKVIVLKPGYCEINPSGDGCE